MGFPGGSAGKESTCNVRDLGSIPGLGRSPGKGKGYPLQYSGLENSTDSIVHGVAKSRTRLSGFHFTSLQTMNKEILFEFFFQIFFLGVRERSGGNSLRYRPTRFSCVTKTAPKVWGLPSPPHPQLPGLQAPQDPAAPSSPALGRVIHWQRRKPALQGWSPRRKDSWAMKCDQLRSKGRWGALQPEHAAHTRAPGDRRTGRGEAAPQLSRAFRKLQRRPGPLLCTMRRQRQGMRGGGSRLHCSGGALGGPARPPPTSYEVGSKL